MCNQQTERNYSTPQFDHSIIAGVKYSTCRFHRSLTVGFLVLLSLISVTAINAQTVWLHEYEGTLGTEKIGLTLVGGSTSEFKRGDNLECSYFYVRHLKDIPMRCSINQAGDFVFEELDEQGKVAATFRGKLLKNEVDNLGGVWTKTGSTSALPVKLSLGSSITRSGGSRYAEIEAKNDADFERQVQEFRNAVLNKDKQTVASFIQYPVTVQVNKKPLKIRNKAVFLQNYDKIFRPSFVEAVRQTVPHNMFTKYTGAMLGSGIVWFWGDGKVIAINNY